MTGRNYFFAGGGTGGHIYPAIAIAEKIIQLEPDANIHFFCSKRDIDLRILSQTNYKATVLPAGGFSIQPGRLINFVSSFFKSYKIAKDIIAQSDNPVVIGIGGFVAGPACYAAHKLKKPLALVNVDIVPGKANKLISRWANEIFVQFEDTGSYFTNSRAKVTVTGCPLRSSFDNPQPQKVIEKLSLEKDKKILLITGASSGSASINEAFCSLLDKFDNFADNWQIVHLTGVNNFEKIKAKYCDVKIAHKVLDYFDDMAELLAAADLVIGRSGAVSVAEYAAAQTPSICMPYPHHKDMHQYLNAGKLVEAGAAVIVDDLPDAKERAKWLWEELEVLLKDEQQRQQMKQACAKIADRKAALNIAENLLRLC